MSSPLGGARRAAGVLTDQSEAERTGDRRRLDKFDGYRIAKAMRGRAADECAAGFVKAKVLLADAARWNKTVSAGFVELDEQSGTRHSGNMSVENRSDAVGQEVGD